MVNKDKKFQRSIQIFPDSDGRFDGLITFVMRVYLLKRFPFKKYTLTEMANYWDLSIDRLSRIAKALDIFEALKNRRTQKRKKDDTDIANADR